MDDHPSFEDLSAYHDGEAPEWTAHVAGCRTCQDTVAVLATLTAAVAEPLPSPGPASEPAADAVRRAVAAAEQEGEPGGGDAVPLAAPARPAPLPSRSRWLVTAVAAAAAVVVVAAGLAVVLRRSPGPDSTTAAGAPPSTELTTPEAATGAPAVDATATALVGGDLGEIPDRATLLAKVGPELSSGGAMAGEGGAGVPAAPPVRSTVPGVPAAPDPRVVGTRPCEVEARAGQATLGDVVYVAPASSAGRPAVVLAFAPVSGAGPVTVKMLATSGCSLLLEATTP